ncbi:MAG: M48 family metalloprotease [Bacteroidales bacterium]|jgi:putative metalloprotease|nr:M48 family metalloprotease [Bacteroidales bacterium]MBQ1680421.1 M48 family metalloprotease [Bacteroidales bacterium]MBQ5435934.1 M48 family metalloprotease [Bacteroidales bacterium]MBQ5482417.1 M48 family metalloprotease [Bacteroidales bacterium]MBQ5517330.1 M48 family metalloprotease [Bacteroidales bacterium]
MKKSFFALLVASMLLSGCGILANGLSNMDPAALATAANTAMTALSISDEQIAQLSAQSVAYMDSINTVDRGAYDARLRKLMSKIKTVDGMPINLKVYRTKEINAFACGDGSIRVYSGLMDAMDDAELMAVIGHEIGHVVHKDTKNAMKKTYMAYAARIALGSTGSVIGQLSTSVLGDIAQSYLNAQYSQKQEFAADEHGFQFAIDQGYSPYSMYNSLMKLLKLNGESADRPSGTQTAFSSHPATQERAARMKAAAEAYGKK